MDNTHNNPAGESIELTTEEKFAAVATLRKRLEDDFIALGSLLSEIKRTKAFRLRGYKNFKEFVESEYGMAGSFAARLIGIHDLFVDELDIVESQLTNIGMDKLNIIKPMVKDCSFEETESWVDKASSLTASELRDEVKDVREQKKEKTNKEVFVEQYIERMTTVFNCSRRELDYKLAVFFQDRNLDEVKDEIRVRQRRLEEAGEMEGMR
ncbi:MAG: hypothetical protein K8R90_10850 [Candidatus Cloacimonetes bacterium]|nr:hypothetical protein [Candidatus Cloacimonadota bacterium]